MQEGSRSERHIYIQHARFVLPMECWKESKGLEQKEIPTHLTDLLRSARHCFRTFISDVKSRASIPSGRYDNIPQGTTICLDRPAPPLQPLLHLSADAIHLLTSIAV